MACSLAANAAFNNNLFSRPTIRPMTKQGKPKEPSFLRLLELAAEKGASGPSAVATALDVSEQNVTNWGTRGVSYQGAVSAQKKFGASPLYIAEGVGAKWVTADATDGDASRKNAGDPKGKSSEVFAPYADDARQSFAELARMLDKKQRYALRTAIRALFTGPDDNHILDRDQVMALLSDHLYSGGLKAPGFEPLSRQLHPDTLGANGLPEEQRDGTSDPTEGGESASRSAAGGGKT